MVQALTAEHTLEVAPIAFRVQYVRVLLLELAMPVVTTLLFHPPSGAGSLHADRTYVLAVQVIPVFAMLLLAPLLGRYFRRRRPAQT
jgi:uncharacterized membrane protein AbrB (regulator of aidB expression)